MTFSKPPLSQVTPLDRLERERLETFLFVIITITI